MQTIVTATQKGGSGKTTVIRNLAVAAAQQGQRVLLMDLDPQKSLFTWWNRREAEDIEMIDATVSEVEAILKEENDNFDLCYVDTPPSVSDWLPQIIDISDLVFIPCKLSPDDIVAVQSTLKLTPNKAHLVVPSMTDMRSKVAKDALEEITEIAGAEHIAPPIGNRAIYPDAAWTGNGVTDAGMNNAKAIEEIEALLNAQTKALQEA